MSFGLSPSDVLKFAEICHDVYSFCRNTPGELQDLADKLDKIGHKLDLFSNILERSGLGIWKQAPALEQKLLDAKICLEPLRDATHKRSSLPAKAKGLAKTALSKEKLRRIEKILDETEREVDSTKIDVILACSLRTLQHGTDTRIRPSGQPSNASYETSLLLDEIQPTPVIAPSLPLITEVDRSSLALTTVSNASKALAVASSLRSQPGGNAEFLARSSPQKNRSRSDQITNNFISEVVSLAEATELYSEDADPSRNIEQLNGIAEKAIRLKLALQSSSSDSSLDILQDEPLPADGEITPNSVDQEIYGCIPSSSASKSIRGRPLPYSQQAQVKAIRTVLPKDLPPSPPFSSLNRASSSDLTFRLPPANEDEITPITTASTIDAALESRAEPSKENVICLRGRPKVSLTQDPQDSFNCSFELEVSEGSALLSVNKLSPKVNAIGSSGRLSFTSMSSSRSSQSVNRSVSQIFQHCLEANARSIPHLLHPGVEGPEEEPDAPYTITFKEPQCISMERASGPQWTTSLMYIFDDRKDQMTLCEKIFGKTLLMIAGSNRIILDGKEVSHASAIALWAHGQHGAKSMTFFPTVNQKDTAPKDIEVEVRGIWDAKKATSSTNILAISVVKKVPRANEEMDSFATPSRHSSPKSSGTFLRRWSTASSGKSREPGELKCVVEFTLDEDKKKFLSHVK